MAQKVQIILEDDLTGGPADETVTFSLDGGSYEIDLSTANAAALREAFAPYVGHARKVGRASGRASKKAAQVGASAGEIRAWAKSNGFDVPERGRIPANVREAFDAAS
jgi:hypothetical protein